MSNFVLFFPCPEFKFLCEIKTFWMRDSGILTVLLLQKLRTKKLWIFSLRPKILKMIVFFFTKYVCIFWKLHHDVSHGLHRDRPVISLWREIRAAIMIHNVYWMKNPSQNLKWGIKHFMISCLYFVQVIILHNKGLW